MNQHGSQGLQFSLRGSESKQLIEADGIDIARLTGVLDAVGTQDVEGKRLNAGHDAQGSGCYEHAALGAGPA